MDRDEQVQAALNKGIMARSAARAPGDGTGSQGRRQSP